MDTVGQQSLLQPVYSVPPAIVEFLSGFASRFAFGDHPTAEQKRQAARVGEDCAKRLADLRAAASPQPQGDPR